MSSPLLTIVIPVRNRENIIVRTLDSIAAQTYQNFKLIVVDNNSTDATLHKVKSWAAEHTEIPTSILSEKKEGACCARNLGLHNVDTQWTLFFDSDDTMRPSLLKSINDIISADSTVQVIGWETTLHNLNGTTHNLRFTTNDLFFNAIMRSTFATQRYCAQTELFRQAGEWNEQLLGWNDIELSIRLLLLKPKVAKLPDGQYVDVFSQEKSITGTDFSSASERWEKSLDTCHKTLANHNMTREITLINTKRAVLAAHYHNEGAHEKARNLLNTVKADPDLSFCKLFVIRAIYLLIRLKVRGTSYLARLIY